MPTPRQFADHGAWAIGTPDLIVKMQDIVVKGTSPDWWGEIPSVSTGLTEDRYVAALEIKEINDMGSKAGSNRAAVGGRFAIHHMIWRTQVIDERVKTGLYQTAVAAGARLIVAHSVNQDTP
jgi:hypothetical protein